MIEKMKATQMSLREQLNHPDITLQWNILAIKIPSSTCKNLMLLKGAVLSKRTSLTAHNIVYWIILLMS